MSSKNIEWALAYAAQGFAVVPVWYKTGDDEDEARWHCSCDKGAGCDRPAKHPIPKQGVKQATTDPVRIRAWWNEHPDANVAIATGEASKIIVIDVDMGGEKAGDVSLTQACAEHGGVPQTLKARSGSGGSHYVYRWRVNPFTRKIGFLKDVDYLSDGGYFIVQPSINMKGNYAWDREFAVETPDDVASLRASLAELPDWFDKLDGYGRKGRKNNTRRKSDAQRPSTVAAMEFHKEDPRWITEVRRALTFCDPDSRDLWVLFGIILGRTFERSDDGWGIYDEWCARSAKYSEKGTQDWMRSYYYTESLNDPQGGEPAGVGTIFHHASDGGWSMPLSGLDSRPTIVYRAGRATETAEVIMRLLDAERETEGDITRIFAFGSGLGAVIEGHDSGTLYTEDGRPPSGWVLNVKPFTPMHLGSRITHSATIVKISANGSAQQVECPAEVSDYILGWFGKRFPRLTGIVQWPMVIDGKLIGSESDYDAKVGLLFSLPAGLDFNDLKGTRVEAEKAWKWIRGTLLADFPFGGVEDEAAALALLLSFMQRRALPIAPAFLITAPLQGTGKTALVKFASRIVHGRQISASKLSPSDEEQRKTITSQLATNPPALLFDNLTAGSMFDSESIAIALTSSEWSDRKLGQSEQMTLPNRAVWCFTGNNVSLIADLRRRFLTIRMIPKERMHYAKQFKRDLDSWAIEHRSEALRALAAITLWASRETPALTTESGFPGWDRAVRWSVFAISGVDPYTAATSAADDEDPMEGAMGAVMVAWAMFCGADKKLVRDFTEALEGAAKSSDSTKKRAANAAVEGVAMLRQKEVRNLSPMDYGYAIKSMMDRLVLVSGIETSFKRVSTVGGSAWWRLARAGEIAEKAAGEF
jgi:putative DNA primase/helicase